MRTARVSALTALMLAAVEAQAQKVEKPASYECTEEAVTRLGKFTVTRLVFGDQIDTSARWDGKSQSGALSVSGLWNSSDLRTGFFMTAGFKHGDVRLVRVQFDPCRDWKVCGGGIYYSSRLLKRPSGTAYWGAVVSIAAYWGALYVHLIDQDDNTLEEDRIDISVFNGVENELRGLLDKTAARAAHAATQCEPFEPIVLH